MSCSVGVCRAVSNLEILDCGHDNDSASCTPVSPACRRSSRSRCPSAARASWTLCASKLFFGDKLIPFHSVMPSDISPVIMPHDLNRVLIELTIEKAILVIEIHTQQPARVKQPVIMVGQPDITRSLAVKIANILTCIIVVPRVHIAESTVITQWKVDHPNTHETTSSLGRGSDRIEPARQPRNVLGRACQEPVEILPFALNGIRVPDFQSKSRVLELAEELPERSAGINDLTQRSPSFGCSLRA